MPTRPPDAPLPPSSAGAGPRPVPERFIVSRGTLRWDRFMNSVIVFGGIGIVIAVFGIFAFILLEIAPLFKGARVEEKGTVPLTAPAGALFGLDEWGRLPFFYDGLADSVFQPAAGGPPQKLATGLPGNSRVTARRYDAQRGRVLVGTAEGKAGFFSIHYQSSSPAPNDRVVTPLIQPGEMLDIRDPIEGAAPAPVVDIAYADSGDRKLYAAIQEEGGRRALATVSLRQKKTLMGKGRTGVDRRDDLTPMLAGEDPVHLLVTGSADSLLALTRQGEVFYFFLDAGGWKLRQRFRPFDEAAGGVAVNFLFGEVSLACHDNTGRVRIYSLFVPEGGSQRTFGLTKDFQPVQGAITWFHASPRNKSFLVGNAGECALCYATTASVRSRIPLPFEAVGAALDAKGGRLGLLDKTGSLHLYEINDPHPEASLQAYFGKVWYEGYPRPGYHWQSTSGTDDFEPKLSLAPLLMGSLKGTTFAMFFAIPIALLSAIYTAQFLDPAMKRIVKPAMEMMASLPSVVLGFLAALWLAPLIENRVPSVLLLVLAVPVSAVVLGALWGRLPLPLRNRLPTGSEYLLLAPVLALLCWVGWLAGPWLESVCFVATMPDGGQIADFRLWWPQFAGLPFEQRNGVVVGLVVGIAVIPVIFTIAEDALSSVPPSLTSAAEALGASRWQVVRSIVLPIASAGVFSAIMIGFGRAVGETMIVVMGTGNTAIFDPLNRWFLGDPGLGGGQFPLADHWNPFNGMRTLSANIAVELPEAAQGSTHFRTLFLCAFLLFAMTFVLNTFAEVMRQRLREKFKIV